MKNVPSIHILSTILCMYVISVYAYNAPDALEIKQRRINRHCNVLHKELAVRPAHKSANKAIFWMEHWDPR